MLTLCILHKLVISIHLLRFSSWRNRAKPFGILWQCTPWLHALPKNTISSGRSWSVLLSMVCLTLLTHICCKQCAIIEFARLKVWFCQMCMVPAVTSSGSSGRVKGGGGPRNMKSMRPPSAAIFFMTYFYRAGGGPWPPRPPPDPLLVTTFRVLLFVYFFVLIMLLVKKVRFVVRHISIARIVIS